MRTDQPTPAMPVVGDDHPQAQLARSRRPGPIIAAAAFVGVMVLGIASLVFVRSLFGSPFGAAAAMPADTDIYIGVDLLQFRDTASIDNLVSAWTDPMTDAGLIEGPTGSFVDLLGTSIEEEVGISFADDVVPWLGRSAGIGIDDLDAAMPTVYAVIDVRDRAKAEAFLDKAIEVIRRDRPHLPLITLDHEGVTINTVDGEDEGEGFAYALTDGHLVLATSDEGAIRALDATKGDNLALAETFNAAMAELPADRALAIYVSRHAFDSFAQSIRSGFPAPPTSQDEIAMEDLASMFESIEAMAGSVAILDGGVRFDAVILHDLEGLSAADVPPQVALPGETLGYLSLPIDGPARLETLRDDEAAADLLDEVVGELNLGFDPVADIFGNMTGRFSIATLPTAQGWFTTESGVPLGFTMSWDLVDEGIMEMVDSQARDLLANAPVEFVDDGVTTVVSGGRTVLAYEIRDGKFVIGTAGDIVESVAAPPSSVGDTSLHQELDAVLPGDGLVLFADVHAILGTIDASEQDRAVVGPIRGIGAGVEVTDNVSRSAFAVLIDTE